MGWPTGGSGRGGGGTGRAESSDDGGSGDDEVAAVHLVPFSAETGVSVIERRFITAKWGIDSAET